MCLPELALFLLRATIESVLSFVPILMRKIELLIITIAILVFACQKPNPVSPITNTPLTPTSPIRKLFFVSAVAGNGIGDFNNGASVISTINHPIDVVADPIGNLYVSEKNHIRKVTASGEISTLAGNGKNGYVDSIGLAAEFTPGGRIDIVFPGKRIFC